MTTLYCEHCMKSYDVRQKDIDIMLDKDPGYLTCIDGGYHYTQGCFFKMLARQKVYDNSKKKKEKRMTTRLLMWLEEKRYAPDNLDKAGEHGNTALMRASLDGNAEIAKELLALGALISAKNDDGNQALWLACFSENVELVSMLIEAGCDIDNPNVNGVTPLMYTASSGKALMTEMLLQAGADASIKSPDDFTALELAATPRILRMLRVAVA